MDKSIAQGAATTLYGCLEPALAEPALRGSYLSDCAVVLPSLEGQDLDKVKRKALWQATEEQLQEALKRLAVA